MIIGVIGSRGTVPTANNATTSFLVDNNGNIQIVWQDSSNLGYGSDFDILYKNCIFKAPPSGPDGPNSLFMIILIVIIKILYMMKLVIY